MSAVTKKPGFFEKLNLNAPNVLMLAGLGLFISVCGAVVGYSAVSMVLSPAGSSAAILSGIVAVFGLANLIAGGCGALKFYEHITSKAGAGQHAAKEGWIQRYLLKASGIIGGLGVLFAGNVTLTSILGRGFFFGKLEPGQLRGTGGLWPIVSMFFLMISIIPAIVGIRFGFFNQAASAESADIKVDNVNAAFKRAPTAEPHASKAPAPAPTPETNNLNILVAPFNPAFGKAVFITGTDPQLGAWASALRLTFNSERQHWEFVLPAGLKDCEYKFLSGDFDLGEKVSISELSFEAGSNRMYATRASGESNQRENGKSAGNMAPNV